MILANIFPEDTNKNSVECDDTVFMLSQKFPIIYGCHRAQIKSKQYCQEKETRKCHVCCGCILNVIKIYIVIVICKK